MHLYIYIYIYIYRPRQVHRARLAADLPDPELQSCATAGGKLSSVYVSLSLSLSPPLSLSIYLYIYIYTHLFTYKCACILSGPRKRFESFWVVSVGHAPAQQKRNENLPETLAETLRKRNENVDGNVGGTLKKHAN